MLQGKDQPVFGHTATAQGGYQRIDFRSLVKRLFDILVALAMLATFLPLMLIIAALIAVSSGGGVIFAHERVGRDGRSFRCLKFRTMVKDADRRLEELLKSDAAAQREWNARRKLRHDPRIVPVVGHFLRQSSLDELPQILNVLRGDMSVVGPRPIIEDELAYYGSGRRLYLSVRPGLTGPWQVGDRSDSSYETRVKQDIEYVQSWSLLTDLQIVLKTAAIVLRGRSPGAY